MHRDSQLIGTPWRKRLKFHNLLPRFCSVPDKMQFLLSGVKFARLTVLLNSISVPTLVGKSIRLKSWKFLEIGTLEDLAVSLQVTGILYKIAMQSLEAETGDQMCHVPLFLLAVIYPLKAELTEQKKVDVPYEQLVFHCKLMSTVCPLYNVLWKV